MPLYTLKRDNILTDKIQERFIQKTSRNGEQDGNVEDWFQQEYQAPCSVSPCNPDTILACIPNDGNKIVLDPFMGSGTVAISAIKHNFHWLGFELLDEYVDMANNRIRNFYYENYSNGIAYGNCFPIDIP